MKDAIHAVAESPMQDAAPCHVIDKQVDNRPKSKGYLSNRCAFGFVGSFCLRNISGPFCNRNSFCTVVFATKQCLDATKNMFFAQQVQAVILHRRPMSFRELAT